MGPLASHDWLLKTKQNKRAFEKDGAAAGTPAGDTKVPPRAARWHGAVPLVADVTRGWSGPTRGFSLDGLRLLELRAPHLDKLVKVERPRAVIVHHLDLLGQVVLRERRLPAPETAPIGPS
eukprot:1074586-Prorocentrum_minimum.AAC.1